MKLFLVIYLHSAVGATFGPLPYDMIECQRRKADLLAHLDEAYASGRVREGTRRSDWAAECLILIARSRTRRARP